MEAITMKAQIGATTSIEYDDAGKGPVIILLHGFPLCKSMWRPQALALQNDYRVLVPDLRGFGGSSPFDEAPSLDQMADDVAGLLAALKINEPVVVGGLSMGGYIALAVARKYPKILRAVILADTRAEADDAKAKASRDSMIGFAQTHEARDVIEQMLPKLLTEKSRTENPDLVEEIRQMASAQTTAGIIGALKVLRDRPDARPVLSTIRVPTLVLVGAEDTLTPPAMAETLATGITNANLVTIPAAGHMSNLEQPDLFNAALAEFLRSLSNATT
jgi:3-oxoadipate enol-lactonase